MNDDRLIEIETKLAYQEDLLQHLDKIVTNQQKQIDKLELTCVGLVERLKEVAENGPEVKMADERPPHY